MNCHWKAGASADIVDDVEFQKFDQYDDEKRLFAARAIWEAASPLAGSNGQFYLRNTRSIKINLPPSIRYSDNLKHTPSGRHFPGLVAAVQNPLGRIVAIQRIFLDGEYKARISPNKMSLGSIGNGAVRLGKAEACIGIAEGIETALSAMEIFGIPCWAALGRRFDAVDFPDSVTTIIAFADNGEPGIDAVQRLKHRWHKKKKIGWKFPKEQYGDWNDQLLGEGVHAARQIG